MPRTLCLSCVRDIFRKLNSQTHLHVKTLIINALFSFGSREAGKTVVMLSITSLGLNGLKVFLYKLFQTYHSISSSLSQLICADLSLQAQVSLLVQVFLSVQVSLSVQVGSMGKSG